MDTQARVSKPHYAGNCLRVLNTLVKVFPEALAQTPLLVPALAGYAASNPNPTAGELFCESRYYPAALRQSPHARAFQAAVTSVRFEEIAADVRAELEGFDESRVSADLEQELSLVAQARKERPVVNTDSDATSGSSIPAGWPRLPDILQFDLPPTQWQFLPFTWGKPSVTFDEIKKRVLGNEEVTDKSVQALVSKVNSALDKQQILVTFRTKSLIVYPDLPPS